MKKLTAYSGLVLLFIAGIGIGTAGHSAWMKERIRQYQKYGPALLRGKTLHRMTDRLELSLQQREQITAILKENQKKMLELQKKRLLENKARQRGTLAGIKDTLTEEQRIKFENMVKKYQAHQARLQKQRTQKKKRPQPPKKKQNPTPQKTTITTNGASADSAPAPNASSAE